MKGSRPKSGHSEGKIIKINKMGQKWDLGKWKGRWEMGMGMEIRMGMEIGMETEMEMEISTPRQKISCDTTLFRQI